VLIFAGNSAILANPFFSGPDSIMTERHTIRAAAALLAAIVSVVRVIVVGVVVPAPSRIG